MIGAEDLPNPEQRFRQAHARPQGTLATRTAIDAWFHLLTLPASLWIATMRNLHDRARHAAR